MLLVFVAKDESKMFAFKQSVQVKMQSTKLSVFLRIHACLKYAVIYNSEVIVNNDMKPFM